MVKAYSMYPSHTIALPIRASILPHLSRFNLGVQTPKPEHLHSLLPKWSANANWTFFCCYWLLLAVLASVGVSVLFKAEFRAILQLQLTTTSLCEDCEHGSV